MPRSRKNKQPKKGKGKPSLLQSAMPIAGSIAKIAAPLLMKGLMGLLPFPESGARAVASPGASYGGSGGMAVSAPSANGTFRRTLPAQIRQNSSGMRVRHTEFISDVVHGSETDFEVLLFEAINPCNGRIFPWLAPIARRFETYRFRSLRFIYEPQTSTTSVGTVMIAVDYDASDDAPNDKTDMMAYKNAVRSPPWFACVNTSAVSDLSKRLSYFTRNSGQTSNVDPKLYDTGKLILALQSEAAAYTAGEIYVEYEIELQTPVLKDSTQSKMLPWFTVGATPGFVNTPTTPKRFPVGTLAVETNLNHIMFESADDYLVVISGTGSWITGSTTQGAILTAVTPSVGISLVIQKQITLTSTGTGGLVTVYLVRVKDTDSVVDLTTNTAGSNISVGDGEVWITPIQSTVLENWDPTTFPSGIFGLSRMMSALRLAARLADKTPASSTSTGVTKADLALLQTHLQEKDEEENEHYQLY